jgi:hypothetical protein
MEATRKLLRQSGGKNDTDRMAEAAKKGIPVLAPKPDARYDFRGWLEAKEKEEMAKRRDAEHKEQSVKKDIAVKIARVGSWSKQNLRKLSATMMGSKPKTTAAELKIGKPMVTEDDKLGFLVGKGGVVDLGDVGSSAIIVERQPDNNGYSVKDM